MTKCHVTHVTWNELRLKAIHYARLEHAMIYPHIKCEVASPVPWMPFSTTNTVGKQCTTLCPT